MVDLPQVPRRLTTIQSPQSNVQMMSEAAAASPYRMLATALDKAGETLENIAVPFAEEAGYRAVTQDEDGNIKVDRAPIVGKAGVAYSRAVKMSALIASEGEANRALLEIGDQFRNDPDGFLKAAKAFQTEKSSQYQTAAGTEVALSLQKAIESHTTQIYRRLRNEKERTDIKLFAARTDTQLSTLSDEIEVLARNGAVGTKEYNAKIASMDSLLKDAVDNPLLGYPKEKADSFRDETISRARGAAVLKDVEQRYRERGYQAAKDYLRDTVRDPKLGLSLKGSDKIERAGLSWLRTEEAGLQGERTAIRAEWAAARDQIESMPDSRLRDMATRAYAAGAHEVGSDIERRMASLDTVNWIRSLPKSEQARIVATGIAPLPATLTPPQRRVAGKVEQEARAQGVDPALAATIGFRESSFNPDAVPLDKDGKPLTSARGVFQLTAKARAELGVADDADEDAQIRGGVQMIKSVQAGLRASLGRDPTPAETYIGYFQGAPVAAAILKAGDGDSLKTTLDNARPGWTDKSGKTWGDVVIAKNSWLANYPTVGAFKQWAERRIGGEDLTASRTGVMALGILRKELARGLDGQITAMTSSIKKLEIPDPAEIESLGVTVYAIGTDEQKRNVREMAATAEHGAAFQTMPAAERAAALARWDERLKTGASSYERETLVPALHAADQKINEGFKKDPYGTAYRYMPHIAVTPAADPADPAKFASVIAQRHDQQYQIRAAEGLGAFSVLRPSEGEAVKSVLTGGSADQATAVLSTLARLNPDIYRATMASEPIKAALDGMARSYEPAKINAAMSVYDQMWRTDPQGFNATFGKEAARRLQTWQGIKDSMGPAEIAEYFKRADDPGFAKVREQLESNAAEATKKITPADITNMFATARVPLINTRIPFTGPDVPMTEDQRALLKIEFDNIYRERYVDLNGDAAKAQTQAAQRLGQMWGQSAVNNGAMTRRAPELHYKPVNNSHDWMQEELNSEVEKIVGKPRMARSFSYVPGVPPGPQLVEQWTTRVLADKHTETDIAAGRPPSYVLFVYDRDGVNIALGEDGRPRRFSWDQKAADAAGEKRFGAAREVSALERSLDDDKRRPIWVP